MGSSFSKIKECTQPSNPIPPSSSSLKHGPKEKKKEKVGLFFACCLVSLPIMIFFLKLFLAQMDCVL
jgi:hypothetical protein